MDSAVIAILSLINETLASAIVIVAFSLLLYNLSRNLNNTVARTSALVLGCVTAAYLCDVLISLDPSPGTYRAILRLQWLGIAFMPVALVHLSDALLETTGLPSRGRRSRIIQLMYLISAVFLLSAAFGESLIRPMPATSAFTTGTFYSLEPGPLFPVYIAYFVVATTFAFINVGRARQRCLTRDTRRRMGYLQFAMLTPALGIFPFSLLLGAGEEYSLVGLLLVNAANIVVILMLAFLAYPLSFFGSRVPDRVVKTELLRFFLRGPMTGVIALVTVLYTFPATRIIGIPGQSFAPFAVVATVLMWQWFVAIVLPVIERRLVYADDDREQFMRLQTLSERLLTRDDYVQLLEATLASICEYMRVGSAFVISLLETRPDVIARVGPLVPDANSMEGEADSLREHLASAEEAQLVVWRGFWVAALNGRRSTSEPEPIGLLGLQARAPEISLTEDEQSTLAKLLLRAETTLEDMAIQTQIIHALEGLLPQIGLTAEAREQIEYLPPRAPNPSAKADLRYSPPVDREQFNEQVRAALRHYWGGPGLTNSRLLDLHIVRRQETYSAENPARALRSVLQSAIEAQRPPGERKLLSPEWTLYNILELRFIKGEKVRDVGQKLAMSDADLYRKQRVAIDAVADVMFDLEYGSASQQPTITPLAAPSRYTRDSASSGVTG